MHTRKALGSRYCFAKIYSKLTTLCSHCRSRNGQGRKLEVITWEAAASSEPEGRTEAGRGGRKEDALRGEHRQNGSQDRRKEWVDSGHGHSAHSGATRGKTGMREDRPAMPTAPAPGQDSPSAHSGLRIMP